LVELLPSFLIKRGACLFAKFLYFLFRKDGDPVTEQTSKSKLFKLQARPLPDGIAKLADFFKQL
jgi:hypothetical protein